MFELIPCLVLSKGSVWLPPGNGTDAVSHNPLRIGLRFKTLGAKTLYIIDLDAAHRDLSAAPAVLLGLAHAGIRLWVGGGVRTVAEAQRLIAAGAAGVVVRTLAKNDAQLREMSETIGPDRVIVSQDVAVDETSDPPALSPLARTIALAESYGISRFILSLDASRRTPVKPNGQVLKELVAPNRWIAAASGIRTSTDLLRLQKLGIDGAIVGRALYDHPLAEFWEDPSTDAG